MGALRVIQKRLSSYLASVTSPFNIVVATLVTITIIRSASNYQESYNRIRTIIASRVPNRPLSLIEFIQISAIAYIVVLLFGVKTLLWLVKVILFKLLDFFSAPLGYLGWYAALLWYYLKKPDVFDVSLPSAMNEIFESESDSYYATGKWSRKLSDRKLDIIMTSARLELSSRELKRRQLLASTSISVATSRYSEIIAQLVEIANTISSENQAVYCGGDTLGNARVTLTDTTITSFPTWWIGFPGKSHTLQRQDDTLLIIPLPQKEKNIPDDLVDFAPQSIKTMEPEVFPENHQESPMKKEGKKKIAR